VIFVSSLSDFVSSRIQLTLSVLGGRLIFLEVESVYLSMEDVVVCILVFPWSA
jgi:hypothetical protein